MRVRHIRVLAVVAVGLALASRIAIDRMVAAVAAETAFAYEGVPFERNPARFAAIDRDAALIRPLHARKAPTKAGEWLTYHKESQQGFGFYQQSSPPRPSAERTTLYIQPWGDFDAAQAEVVAQTAEGLSRFYGVPVKMMAPRSLDTVPHEARLPHPERGDRRLLTSYVLGELRAVLPADGFAVMAMTAVDLTRVGRGSWAFGQASLFEGVAVCSLYRHGDPRREFTTCLRRSLKTALHEAGHVLGITHCVDYECAMNGANSREEADSRPMWFCAEDETKVWLACRLDPAARYARLVEFAASNGLAEEARFWAASRDALMSKP